MRRTVLSAVAVFFLMTSWGYCAEIPREGTALPALQLSSPPLKDDAGYLGIRKETFGLKDIESKVVLVEIIGVYCQRCYQQAPLFNKLFARIEKKGLAGKVKMLAVAAGGTTNEVEHLRTSNAYDYPVVKDEAYAIHKLLGEPRTPFTLLVGKDGKVLFAHLGILEDTDALFQKMEELVK